MRQVGRPIRVIIALLAALVFCIGALYAGQRSLIYFPQKLRPAEFQDVVHNIFGQHANVFASYDAVVVDPPPNVKVVATAIFFHGNAGLGVDRAYLRPEFAARGLRLIFAEYPGYGARPGSPTERALVGDGAALYSEVLRRYPVAPIILIGESLGSGVATQVATRELGQPPARLVLLVPFLSLTETAARAYPFLPARHLVKDHFDSASALPRYPGSVAILVAGRDEVVGADQGRALATIARSRGETAYVELPEAGHNSWPPLMTEALWTELLGFAPAVPEAPDWRSGTGVAMDTGRVN